MQNVKDLDKDGIKKTIASWGFPQFHADQVLAWVFKKTVSDFDEMTDIPAPLRQRLKEDFYISELTLAEKIRSKDLTEKFLFSLKDGSLIESVCIPARDRVTGCVSTQVGCKFGCLFCMSGLSGFKKDLTSGQILDQAVYIKRLSGQLTHIVFMGMGEPLDNYDNTITAVRAINADWGLNIGARRITISTCGIVPGIEKLSKEGLQIELSVSLHSSFDKVRDELMPINKRYPLKELIAACRKYQAQTNRQITFEYIMIKDVNSSLADAKNLGKILSGLDCKINLIPINPGQKAGFLPPNKLDLLFFKDELSKNRIRATVRRSRGKDIEAACGQLRLRHEKN